jgi:DNA-binding MurR/RpiR family transcriptional regulator
VVSTIVVAILGFSTPLLRSITHALGILYEASTVFFFGLGFATAMLLYLSVKLSRMGQDHLTLTRELAFLRLELERLRGEGAPPTREQA